MEKIRYFFASLYQNIKNRQPDGTSYGRLNFGVAGSILLTALNVFLILKLEFNINLISHSKQTFMTFTIILAALIMLLFWLLFPKKDLVEIEVNTKDIKRNGIFAFSYYVLSVIVMLVLIYFNRGQ